MHLKPYQRQALAALSDFLAAAQEGDHKEAFEAVVNSAQPDGLPTLKQRLGRYYRPYEPAKGLADTPYVCLRLPTGGGKTILAAHSIAAVRDSGIGGDYPLVLWLVPSDIIQTQTAEALADPKHPYRQALDAAFDGRVRVFDIADYAQIRPHDLAQNACIVVGTIQTLRVTDTNKRKVYAHHEDLEPHFSRLGRAALEALPDLERTDSGQVKYSFANLLHLHRPLMLVDEAHNAVTGLSDEMRRRLNPAAVVEFTATPKDRSNILFNVSAAELKQEAMIKLPIVLQEHPHWQAAVVGTVQERDRLARLAEKDAAYIRPLALYQAEPKDREVTVEVLKRHLIDDLKIPEERVAVATGAERGLDGVNLSDPNCLIEHIITVEALKEGWDAPFAYVFCSVASIRSATSVEQLLGRVLRMPYAQRRSQAELNKSYAHVSEASFSEAASALRDKLIDKLGFDDSDIPDVIEHSTQEIDWGPDALFGMRDNAQPVFVQTPDTPQVRAVLEQAGAAVTVAPDGALTVRVADLGRPGLAAALTAAAPTVSAQVLAAVETLSPSQKGEAFSVPRLVTRIQGELAFDLDEIMGLLDWRLSDESPDVPGLVEALDERVRRFELDVDRSQVVQRFLEEERDLFGDAPPPDGWTPELLVNLLAPLVRDESVAHADAIGWLTEVVRGLRGRSQPLSRLMRMKHVLARRLRARVAELKAAARAREARRWLLAPGAPVETLANDGFAFRDGMFDGVKPYRGRHRFNKHFLPVVPDFDGSDGEEVACAIALDGLQAVKFWSRNVANHPNAFWLQTSGGRTYPDFVAELTDGRIFVVEYKGDHLWADSEEKRAIGMAWERAGGGLYLMARKLDGGLPPLGQMLSKLDAAGLG